VASVPGGQGVAGTDIGRDWKGAVHVVIMGCGRVGSTLARALEDRGHTVSVIDSSPDAFRRLGPGFSGDKVTGYGFDQEVLEEAGITRAGAFAAVSSGDNSNIISARVAREMFGIDNVVARIYDPRRAEVYQRLGIPTVATVRWTADQMLRRLLPHGAEPEWRDATGTIRIAVMDAPVKWVGRRLTELEALGTKVAFLTRLGEGILTTPDTVLQDGDLLHLVIAEKGADQIEAAIQSGPEEHH
jgi:trk system potassium uptake protein TrkA